MELHFRGLEVPALGSPRDLIFRAYLSHEHRVEAKKHELNLLIALATPTLADANAKRAWNTEVTKTFNSFTSLMWGFEPQEVSEEDQDWLKYYDAAVKNTEIEVRREKDGKLVATQRKVPIVKEPPNTGRKSR